MNTESNANRPTGPKCDPLTVLRAQAWPPAVVLGGGVALQGAEDN